MVSALSGVAYANCFDAPEARSDDSGHYSRVNGAAETDQAAAVLKHHQNRHKSRSSAGTWIRPPHTFKRCRKLASLSAAIRRSLSKRLDHSSEALTRFGVSTAGKSASPNCITPAEVRVGCRGKLSMCSMATAAKSGIRSTFEKSRRRTEPPLLRNKNAGWRR